MKSDKSENQIKSEKSDEIGSDQRKLEESKEPEKKVVEKKKEKTKPSFFDKEISAQHFIISQFLLLVLGLSFFLGIYFYLNKDNPKVNFKNYYPVTRKPTSLNLEINNPDDEIIVSDKNLIISGSTEPFTTLVISNLTSEENLGLEANQKGEFSKIIPLEIGVNIIKLTAFDSSGNSKEEIRTIYFTQEKIDE